MIMEKHISFERPGQHLPLEILGGVNRSVYTLFVRPPHETLHAEVAELTKCESQPLQPSISNLLNIIGMETMSLVNPEMKRKIDDTELAQLAGVLIQFTDYVPTLQPYAETPYDQIDSIYNGIIDRAQQTSNPLSFAEQLDVALKQTNGDLPESLWRLFITSRLHARWLDGKAINGLPSFSHDEKVEKMTRWQRSLRACKTNEIGFQDVSGDTYYVWTHALATVIFKALPARTTRITQYIARMFEHGTEIMQAIIHKVSPQEVANSHSIAAEYGNAIGKICADKLLN